MGECLHPLYLTRPHKHLDDLHDLRTMRMYRVPCGKCPECLKKKQRSMTARIVTEAQNYSTMHFCTFTYSPKTLPIASSLFVDVPGAGVYRLDQPRIVEDSDFLVVMRERFAKMKNTSEVKYIDYPLDSFVNAYGKGTKFFIRLTPSLNRRDFRLWLKNCRVAYKREFGESLPDFKYVFCGEYGGRFHRPHYHCLFLGLSDSQVHWMCDRWLYGFTLWERCKVDAKDKSAVASYISKYMNKGENDISSVKNRLVEPPRHSMSKFLGVVDDLPVSHFLCYDLFGEYDPDTLKLKDGDYLSESSILTLCDSILERMSIVVPGVPYRLPMPVAWKHKIYYNKIDYNNKLIPSRYVPKRIFKIMQEVAFGADMDLRSRKLAKIRESVKTPAEFAETLVRSNARLQAAVEASEAYAWKTLRRDYSRDAF